MTRRRLVAAAVSLAVIAGVAAPASANELLVDVSVPEEVALGQPAHLIVTVRSAADGQPVEDVAVAFFTDTEFAGVAGRLALGQATTNEVGVAEFEHAFSQLRTYVIEVEIVDRPEVAVDPQSLSVLVRRQLHQAEEGIRIPGLDAWLVTVVIAAVWTVMIVAGTSVVRLARAGRDGSPRAGARSGRREAPRGLLASAITGVMVFVAVGLVVLLIRSPETHHNLDPTGYDRTAVAYVEASYDYPGLGASGIEGLAEGDERGRALFLLRGCAGCHGIRAEGTSAASSPAGVSRGWLENVIRAGVPGLMPSYSAAELTVADIDDLHEFLLTASATLGNPDAPAGGAEATVP